MDIASYLDIGIKGFMVVSGFCTAGICAIMAVAIIATIISKISGRLKGRETKK